MGTCAKEVWRVNEDGQLRDRYGKLTYLFEMSDQHFFESYTNKDCCPGISFIQECRADYNKIYDELPELPFPMCGWQKLWHLNYRNLQLFISVF